MQDLLKTIVTSLVDYPDEVRLTEVPGERSVTYKLSVRQEDMGKVIGKKGRIARSIRTVLNAAGANQDKRVYLDIEE